MADEDDYLSDKFLFGSTATASSSLTKTYSDRRKEAQRKAQLKNEANRRKTRKQIHEEELREGLSTSLFEKAQAERETLGAENKAMNMMMKMGFKLGDSLGKKEQQQQQASADEPSAQVAKPLASPSPGPPSSANLSIEREQGRAEQQHRKVPLSIDIWEGKKGVGLGKRAISPGAVDRIAKAAKVADLEESSRAHETYRSRARDEFVERRAEGRLRPATRTLITLDEKAGIEFNILSLDPHNPETIPPELLDALEEHDVAGFQDSATRAGGKETEAQRLKRQMQLDALQPLGHNGPDDDDGDELPPKKSAAEGSREFSEDDVRSAKEFLGLNAQDRLTRVTTYLRRQYYYCFWCGTQYDNEQELSENCLGEEEDAHD